MRAKGVAALCAIIMGVVLVRLNVLSGGKVASPAKPTVAVSLREGPYAQWHHLGDELVVTYGQETLLTIRLDQATNESVPLTLTVGPKGRIFKWNRDFDDPSLGTATTTYSLLGCNGALVQQYRSILWANFDLGSKESGMILLALPAEGLQYWTLHKEGERQATLVRQVDPCYLNLLKNGGKYVNAGTWDAAMNCALYVDVGGSFRHLTMSLPWPALQPPGSPFTH